MSDNYKSDCKYSEQTISYLYGELDKQTDFQFEAHLEHCARCADEIGGFNLIRQSIGLWKEKEFDLLETPKIEFMPARTGGKAENRVGSIKTWFANVGKLFAPSPVFAAGLMFVVISLALILFTGKFSNNIERAADETGNSQKANDSPSASKTGDRIDNKITGENIETSDARPAESTVSSDNNSTPKKPESAYKQIRNSGVSIKETAAVSKPENKRQTGNIKSKGANFNNLKTVAVNRTAAGKSKNLKLNPIDEDEETSLRLTDLLDAVGEK